MKDISYSHIFTNLEKFENRGNTVTEIPSQSIESTLGGNTCPTIQPKRGFVGALLSAPYTCHAADFDQPVPVLCGSATIPSTNIHPQEISNMS